MKVLGNGWADSQRACKRMATNMNRWYTAGLTSLSEKYTARSGYGTVAAHPSGPVRHAVYVDELARTPEGKQARQVEADRVRIFCPFPSGAHDKLTHCRPSSPIY